MGTLTYRTMPHLSPTQYDLVYNMTSFGLASMAASTVFFFLRISSFAEKYRAALCFTGLVTFIAMYHYYRLLVVHLPDRLHLPDVRRYFRRQGRPLLRGDRCRPVRLHHLGCHLQVRCRLPRLPCWPRQVCQRALQA